MSVQEIQDYKLKWLRTKCFRVNILNSDGEHLEWLQKNLDERVWEMSSNPDNNEHTFFFENQMDSERFRESFQGESRTTDISEQ